jgi:hypothetical protein
MFESFRFVLYLVSSETPRPPPVIEAKRFAFCRSF